MRARRLLILTCFPSPRICIATLGRPYELCSAPPGNGGDQTRRTRMPGSASGPTNQDATAGAARSTPPCYSAPGKADEGGARGAVPTGSRFAGGQRPVNACTRRDVTPPLCTASRPTRSGTLMRPEGPHACRLLSPALRASVGLATLPTRAPGQRGEPQSSGRLKAGTGRIPGKTPLSEGGKARACWPR